jgi:predicted nucleic acid-binding protein
VKRLFVDTSAWYDLLFPGSPEHERIVAQMHMPGTQFVTSTYVLDELTALLLARGSHDTAARAGAHIRSAAEVRVEHPDAAEEWRAWSLFIDRPDKSYTLTDCLSFVMMRRLGIETAVATDRHFSQEGFTVLP